MTRVAVVSTSINARPKAYARWAEAGNLIVAGDHNSPPTLRDYVRELGGTYLDPIEQSQWPWSETIGWGTIQRRNAAIMHALESDFEYIVTVDDDNHPLPNAYDFVSGHIVNMETHAKIRTTIGSLSNFLNTGVFCRPSFHQRGTPYGVTTSAPIVMPQVSGGMSPRIVVSQAQVLGDPDCDAIERMCNAPDVIAVAANAVILPGTYAAFNSQATVWHRDWAPVMAVLPGIGRYDDIFASYLFHRLSRERNVALFVGEPCVRQLRNEHDLVKDLRAELWGMHHVFDFCNALNVAYISADMPLWMAYSELIVATSGVLPVQTVKFAREWVATWKDLV